MSEKKELMTGINSFTRDSLKKTKTSESKANTALAQEQTMAGLAKFDKTALKSVDTAEKNTLPTKETIEQEKKSGF